MLKYSEFESLRENHSYLIYYFACDYVKVNRLNCALALNTIAFTQETLADNLPLGWQVENLVLLA